jgi:DNA-directed RNA polymerase subunit RPC12/RpoP
VPAWSAPPGVELDGQWLVFRYPVRTRRHGRREFRFRRIRAGPGLLTEFVQLEEAPAERILAYARRHGPLGFCQHGDPSHRIRPEGCAPAVCTPDAGQPAVHEDVQWWRNLAGHARALLNVAAQLFKGRVDDTTLARLNPRLLFPPGQLLRAARRDTAPFVVYGMELWLRFFQVRPRTTYNPRRRRFEVRISGAPPLAGALALQIMLALTRWSGIAICASCGKLFPPSRRPNPNRNTYCQACGIRAAWREAQARRRERPISRRRR